MRHPHSARLHNSVQDMYSLHAYLIFLAIISLISVEKHHLYVTNEAIANEAISKTELQNHRHVDNIKLV